MTRCRTTGLLLALVGTTACVNLNTNDGFDVSVWETQLAPERDYPDLSGQAAAVSRFDGTVVGIAIEGAEPGVTHAWGLRLGTCATVGPQIGPDSDYPGLAVGASGAASVETRLSPQLSVDSTYHVAVRVSATDTTRMACGDLVAR